MALDPSGQPSPPPGPAGRAALLAAVEAQLAAGGAVALRGPAGIGRTALLDAVAAAAAARGELVLRVRPAEEDRRVPYAALQELLGQVPRAGLPAPQRAAVAALRRGAPPRGATALARRLAVPALL